jgi:hypothetical protein
MIPAVWDCGLCETFGRGDVDKCMCFAAFVVCVGVSLLHEGCGVFFACDLCSSVSFCIAFGGC